MRRAPVCTCSAGGSLSNGRLDTMADEPLHQWPPLDQMQELTNRIATLSYSAGYNLLKTMQ